jgi:Na+/citrate or Na+/malate symporter
VLSAQTVALPLMAGGMGGGALTDTARRVAGDGPQAFEAVTVTSPAVAPAVAVMEPVPDVPDHPAGNVQV